MLKARAYLFQHVAAPFTAMLILIAGAFFVYKSCYTGPSRIGELALMEPAAGDESAAVLKTHFGHRNLWR